ncbi:hypothetical protein DFH28DRAFT_19053 [Melampsora americana]|nr:hypothetical protein DFH28DRAFT_19053 [Melampsora americana]
MSTHILTESDLGPEARLPPVQLVKHLLGSHEEDKNVDAFDLESAINAFTNFQEPMSNNKISELTFSGSIIVQFLATSKETIGNYEQWTKMSAPMKTRLVHLLNKILNQDFISSLFSLRDHIRTLAFGSNPPDSAPAMATLPDVLIASVIDYINDDSSRNFFSSASLRPCPSWSHQTIELVVRIPNDQEQLMNVLISPTPHHDRLSHEIKLACLSLLYCFCCLDDWSPFQPDQAFDQLSTFITSLDENISASHISVSQILCLYGYLRKSQIYKIQLFKPVTIRKIWILFTSLFPSPQDLVGDQELNIAQNTLLADGGEMMSWVWIHTDFCPDEETKWVGCLTTLWVLTQFTPPCLESFIAPKTPSTTARAKTQRSAARSRNLEIITILSNNDGIGLQILLNLFFAPSPPGGLSNSTWNRIWRSIFSILFDIYLKTCNPNTFEHTIADDRISRLVKEALQRLFENVFDLPQKCYLIRRAMGLPSKHITFFLQKAQKNLHKLLNQTLLVVQQSMESIKTEDTSYMSEATDCLDFLNFWAATQFGI